MKIEEVAKIEDFFMLDTVSLAKELLGKLIIVKNAGKILSGYIVETEAYLGVIDEACHGYKGHLKWKLFIRKQVQSIFTQCTLIKC